MIIQNYDLWSVTETGEKKIRLVRNDNGNRVISTLYLNPQADCSITVKGYVDEEDTVGVALKCVDIANLEKKDSITAKGTYLFVVEPYCKLTISVTGTADIGVKCLN